MIDTTTTTQVTLPTKNWYKSRTVWFAVATGLAGLASATGVVPAPIAAMHVDALATALLAIATVVSRIIADTKLTVSGS